MPDPQQVRGTRRTRTVRVCRARPEDRQLEVRIRVAFHAARLAGDDTIVRVSRRDQSWSSV